MRAEQKPGRRRAEPQSRRARRKAEAARQAEEARRAEEASRAEAARQAAEARRAAAARQTAEPSRERTTPAPAPAPSPAPSPGETDAAREVRPAPGARRASGGQGVRRAKEPAPEHGHRATGTSRTAPARARVTTPRRPLPEVSRGRSALAWLVRTCWLLLLLGGLAACVLPWTPLTLPPLVAPYVAPAGAVTMTTLYTHGLAVRTGGRPLIAGGLALALSTGAVVSAAPVLLAAATVATAAVAAVLAVIATKPAARFPGVVREVVLATLVAAGGAFAVRAYGAAVSVERTGYLAIALALLGALALVYRLGAGLHGLGRRGFVMILSGVALLTVTLAYTEALARWGSPGMIEAIDSAMRGVERTLGAVPRPIEVLLGIPALAWGVSTRARRRQGWWVSAFGAAGFAVVAVSLLGSGRSLADAALTAGYSLVFGLAFGYVVIRVDLFLTGARGRRARRLEELAAHRPEPGRFQPLL